ncbi:hypothetical protein GCM10012275_39540 [Longimycelium tulufanense]|uniref:Uncharacterized protein n=1 Tax=Longimycelium tulufanense TaxID=907463 RepID=A0A8J3CI65_9PSEU|nr:hypothetical protein [Longimycelium tulufanense]GGM65083.1 hypothetical protein GCM10012275_39540 [Longimycelium tulufanense]
MIPCSVPSCGNPATGAVCRLCLGRLAGDLAEVADLVVELEATIARQVRTGQRVGSRPADVGLPYNSGAAEVARDLRNVLSTWVRDLWETYGPRRPMPTDGTKPDGTRGAELEPLDLDNTLRAMAAWLRRHPSWVEQHPAGGDLVDEITDAIERARRAVDLPPARVYCGPCPECGTDLYARPNRATVRCRECDMRHDVEALRSVLLDAARSTLATAAEIARALPRLLGRELSPNTVRTWARNGRLAKRGTDSQGRPRYRVGEVIDLALATPVRRRVTRDRATSA